MKRGVTISEPAVGPAPRSARKFPWTKAEDALLGKMVDHEVATQLNRTLECVRGRRRFLGISAVSGPPQDLRMREEDLLAILSDGEIRARLGWNSARIRIRRRELARLRLRKNRLWTIEEDRLLGTQPDRELARRLGRTEKSVKCRREGKRIRTTPVWRPEDDKILGTRPDSQVALLLRRSHSNVVWRRQKLGIPAKAKPRPWTPAEEELLGRKPDSELAKLFGRTEAAVEARRARLGRQKADGVYRVVRIPASPDGEGPAKGTRKNRTGYSTWTPQEDALLGKVTDEEISRRLGYSIGRIRRRRRRLAVFNPNPHHRHWTKEEIALLGTATDREVAAMVNRSVGNVRFKRIELKIPFFNPRYECWSEEQLKLLGQIPDEEVARQTGHSLLSVRRARHKRHIRAAPR